MVAAGDPTRAFNSERKSTSKCQNTLFVMDTDCSFVVHFDEPSGSKERFQVFFKGPVEVFSSPPHEALSSAATRDSDAEVKLTSSIVSNSFSA